MSTTEELKLAAEKGGFDSINVVENETTHGTKIVFVNDSPSESYEVTKGQLFVLIPISDETLDETVAKANVQFANGECFEIADSSLSPKVTINSQNI